MDFIAKVSKPGFDAGSTSSENLYFDSRFPTLKIFKQYALSAGHATTIAHGVTYPPEHKAYSDVGSELFEAGSDSSTSTFGTKNFYVESDNTNLKFSNNTDPKKILLISDRPAGLGIADTSRQEPYGMVILDDSNPQKTIMSSEYNHLKLHSEGQIVLRNINSNNSTISLNIVDTNTSTNVLHSLGYRPFVVARVRRIYSQKIDNLGTHGGVVDPNDIAHSEVYICPYNTLQFQPIGFVGAVGNYDYFVALYIGIKNDRINFYSKIRSRCYLNNITITEDYEFTYQVFYNDLDETYNYI